MQTKHKIALAVLILPLATFAQDASTTATSTGSTAPYTGANFQEWLLPAGIIIFFLSYMTWGRIFAPIRALFESEEKNINIW